MKKAINKQKLWLVVSGAIGGAVDNLLNIDIYGSVGDRERKQTYLLGEVYSGRSDYLKIDKHRPNIIVGRLGRVLAALVSGKIEVSRMRNGVGEFRCQNRETTFSIPKRKYQQRRK